MKSIYEAQNEKRHIDQLAAQRQLYDEERKLQWFLFLISIPATIIVFLVGNIWPACQTFAAVWGVAIVVLEMAANNVEAGFRNRAVIIQELFDCEVLQLPWNELREKPNFDDIRKYSDKYLSVQGRHEKLTNWYFESPDCLPLPYARIVCQRSNLTWDSHLRICFSRTVLAGLALIILAVLIAGYYYKMIISSFFLFMLLPLAPAIIWCCQQIIKNRKTANNLERLKNLIDMKWEEVFTEKSHVNDLEKIAIELQTDIYHSRKSSLLIPNWIYNFFRAKYQKDMIHTADQLCEEALELAQKYNLGI
ncbi:MAG: hypothetical protein JXA79_11220 [Deltaproteobacteria bacterium]|nr:hypothetical protein [Deltaproteobacteria bacterium]